MVIPKLTRDLPHPFSMDGVVRKDDTLQAKAVREAVTNMVIHSDFMVNGVLKVEKYDDCFVLTNPGLLLTSSSCHPKIFVKEFSYFLMPCHQHCLGVNLLVQR